MVMDESNRVLNALNVLCNCSDEEFSLHFPKIVEVVEKLQSQLAPEAQNAVSSDNNRSNSPRHHGSRDSSPVRASLSSSPVKNHDSPSQPALDVDPGSSVNKTQLLSKEKPAKVEKSRVEIWVETLEDEFNDME
ncbi:MAG: hypothetical protein Q9225_003313 [Loekoesia sp. 1 TL-2023]